MENYIYNYNNPNKEIQYVGKEKLKVISFNEKGVKVLTTSNEECFIFKSKLSSKIIENISDYFYIGMIFEADYYIKNGYRYYNSHNYELENISENLEKSIEKSISDIFILIKNNYNYNLTEIDKNNISNSIKHFDLDNFINEMINSFEKNDEFNIADIIRNLINNYEISRHNFKFSFHSLDRISSERAFLKLPNHLRKNLLSEIIKSSSMISFKGNHIYLSYGDFVIPCVRKKQNFYVIKTILTKEMFLSTISKK